MKNTIKIWLALIFLLDILTFNGLFAKKGNTSSKDEILPGIIYVKFKSAGKMSAQSLPSLQSIQQKYSVRNITQPFLHTSKSAWDEEFTRIFKLEVSPTIDILHALQELRSDPTVEYAEPSYLHQTKGYTPNDSGFASMYSLAIINASAAWDITKGDSTVVIGIVDGGTDYTHEDLAANIWTNPGETGLDTKGLDKRTNGEDDDNNGFIDDWRGWDFVGAGNSVTTLTPDNNPMASPGNNHGTHTAGTASAVTNNEKGVSSIGFRCKLLISKNGDDAEGYTIFSGFEGVLYCINTGANIVSCSWGRLGSPSQFDQDVVRYALRKNVIIVAASGNGDVFAMGNDNEIIPQYPANYHGVLTVGASDSQDKIADFSNYGNPEFVKVFAPGVEILSTVTNNGYDEYSGTSMATPLVAGLAGLIKSKNPSWTAAQIMFQICGTVDNIDGINPKYAGKLGYGRINAYRALTETPRTPKPEISFIGYQIDDAGGGNGNGILEIGEKAKINVIVRNEWGDAQNVTATLATKNWTTTVTKANANYGLLRGISTIDSAQHGSANDDFAISVSANAVPQVIPFTVNFSDNSGYTKQIAFSIALDSRILLVDDDNGVINVEGYYKDALNSLGTSYDVWEHKAHGTPPASILKNYQAVIWWCEWPPSINSDDRNSIAEYLDAGGKLFISGQDIGWDLVDPAGSQFRESSGSSKSFFEQYLKAKYISDNAGVSVLAGVAGDSIGNGLTFQRNQPERTVYEQYPDVIETTGGSVYSFNYSSGTFNGKGGAILYSGNYKLAYFAFGGFESIVDSTSRKIVMERLLQWLFGYSVSVSKLTETENMSTPFTVDAIVSSKSPIENVMLCWDTDGAFPFNKVPMNIVDGKYTATIPTQTKPSNVEYFVLAKTVTGYLPYSLSKFYVGPDVTPPTITVADTIKNTLNMFGPYSITVKVSDNLSLDTSSINLNYSVNAGSEQIVKFKKTSATSFVATITTATAFKSGDIIQYYVTAQDAAKIKNTGRYPASGFKQFAIGKEIVDNFELGKSDIWNYGAWGITTKLKYTGSYSLTDSPDSTYLANSENICVLKNGYDLSSFSAAKLKFVRRSIVDVSDTVYIEASANGSTWTTLKKINGIDVVWKKEELSLNEFTGNSNNAVKVRFRLLSGASAVNDGIYIDDIEILTNGFTLGIAECKPVIPVAYSLSQNYPNPFNPTTTISYQLPMSGNVSLKIFDVLGKEISILVNEKKEAGRYDVTFDASKLSSGLYFYRLQSGDFTSIKKMVLLK